MKDIHERNVGCVMSVSHNQQFLILEKCVYMCMSYVEFILSFP